MKKIFTSTILLILIGSVLFNFSKASAQEQDTFQQVMNYLITGDPYQHSISFRAYNNLGTISTYIETATIFDRQNCVAGWNQESSHPDFDKQILNIQIYWNNVDINSIEIGRSLKYLYFSGAEIVAFEQLFQNDNLVATSSFASYSIPMKFGKKRHRNRLQNAIRLLFTEHCSGMQSAF